MAPCGVAAAPHVRHGVGLATQSRVARKETGVQGLTSATGLAAGRGDVRGSVHPLTRSGAAVMRVSLSEGLALGPAVWDDLAARGGSPSPFMSWAWHRAWLDSAPTEEVAASIALLLHGPAGSLDALLPIRLCRQRFHRMRVHAMTWAVGDVGCPDELDVPALPAADMSSLAEALQALPWKVLIFRNLAEGALHAERDRKSTRLNS